jgi:hypothetical protein
MPTSLGSASPAVRRPAADITEAVLENMRENLESLTYSVLAPSRYVVYLHADEIVRLEGILPVLREQTVRALSETLVKLNAGSFIRRHVGRVFGRRPPQIERAGGEWHVEFLADPDGDVAPGDILVDSELLLPARPELGVGERTRRITTVHRPTPDAGPRVTTRARTAPAATELPLPGQTARPAAVGRGGDPPAGPCVLARLVYEDQAGRRSYDAVKESVTIGRGGTTYPVDVRIVSSPDVSREHARIRRDPASGAFFLIDLSSLGTSLNGQAVPRGYDDIDGRTRENGIETPLYDGARIGLADTIFLDFRIGD